MDTFDSVYIASEIEHCQSYLFAFIFIRYNCSIITYDFVGSAI